VEIAKERGEPKQVVEIAKAEKQKADKRAREEQDENLRFDEVWWVVDVDEHERLHEAKDVAQANGIRLAISNPCFELWLVLHFRESPGCQHRHDIQKLTRNFLPGFDKGVDFLDLGQGYQDAVQRAKRLEQDAHAMGEAGRCPSTAVFHLTESIRADSVLKQKGQARPPP